MLIAKSRASWLAMLTLLLLSSSTYASVVGNHAAKGVLNVTFSKPMQKPVKTVANSDETWIFSANKTFSRGALTGVWKRKHAGAVEATYNRNAYIEHLNAFWANLGVTVSNIRIIENKLLVQEVSNGLSIEESLIYRMDVTESGGTKPAWVSIKGSFVAPTDASENPALRQLFPTMWQGQAAVSASSSFYNATVQVPINFVGSSGSFSFQTAPNSVLATPTSP